MTDTARVSNVYYDMNVYNPLSTQVQAEIDNKLLFPLLNTSDNYSVAVAKAKIPLDSVPLTKSNIPLKLYQLGLKVGTTEEFAYVRQVNANQDNFVWNCPKGSQIITKFKYTSTGVLTQVAQQDISIYVTNVYNFVVDDYSNLFVIGSNSLSEVPNKLYIIDEDNNLLQESDYVHLKHIYIDRGQNLYICDEAPSPLVYIYGMNNEIGQVNITQKATLTTNQAGDPLSNLLFCVADGEIIVGYNQNTITLYNTQYEPQTDIQETSIIQLQNLANINATANTYILANSDVIDDTLFGVNPTNNEVYDVNNNSQYTTFPTDSSVVITTDKAYGIGTDNHTYYISYPVTNPPTGWQGPINNSTNLKAGCLWSSQKLNELYAMSQANQFDVWNFKNSPNPTTLNNDWSAVGEININYPTITAISIDKQPSTNKLVAVGSDNNLYITNDPVAPIEYIYSSGDTSVPDYNYGFSLWDETGNQNTSEIYNFNNIFGNHTQLFKHQNRLFVPQYPSASTNVNLVIYSIKDFSIITTNTNFSTNGVLSMCQLPIASKFIYADNNNNMKIHNISTYALLETNTYFVAGTQSIQQFYEINATHYAVCLGNNQVYIFTYGTTNPVLIITTPSNCVDICVSTSDVTNGANSLFALCGVNGQYDLYYGSQIFKYTFTNNTYTAVNSTTLIYQETLANKYITYIDYLQDQQALVFIDAIVSPGAYSNKQYHTLFFSENYNTNKMTICNITLGDGLEDVYSPTKYNFYLCQSTMSTHRWTQVTGLTQSVKGVTVSRSNSNKFYCLSSTNSKIYSGTLLNGACPLSIVQLFQSNTYNYISTTPNTEGIISSTIYLYGLQSQNLITSLSLSDECGSIARNDPANQYIISYKTQNKVQTLNAQTLTPIFSSTLSGAYRIFVKNGSDIDAGKVDIFDMAVLVNAINSAFVEVQTKINQALGSGTLTSAPSLTLDYLTGLCTLTYPQAFTQSANGVLFNKNLLNLVYYQSTLDPTSGLYQLILNTQQESTTQQTKSIYNFNQLDKILFQSNCIYVVGAYFGKNQSNNIITDIDVVIGDYIENLGQILYFQPNFLRTYALQSNLPLERIQINILFQYRDGTEYQLYINQGQNATTKLQFVKKF
jgi:hypothetical protein